MDSYACSVTVPVKICFTTIATDDGKIIPRHATIFPTNICNLNCPFCSHADCDRKSSIDFQYLKEMIKEGRYLGLNAITLSGGGEPLCYSDIIKLLQFIQQQNIKIGLITNGSLLHSIPKVVLHNLTWCRISMSDTRDMLDNRIIDIIKSVDITWGYNYILTENPNKQLLLELLKQAAQLNFEYFRITTDQHNNNIKSLDITLPKFAYFFNRNIRMRRGKECYIGLLKPTINADGFIYPCCHPTTMKGLNSQHIIAKSFQELYDKQPVFDGHICSKCPFMEYNEILNKLKSITHTAFL
ncbi:MAG: radical SAM protein [Bacteroidetes bacterium]|nr:radical SAM protein [Bacteroidota bacterium]